MSERPSSTAIWVALGPHVHAHEVAADRPALALAAPLAGRASPRRARPALVAEVGRDRLAGAVGHVPPLPRPAATARRRRRRRRRPSAVGRGWSASSQPGVAGAPASCRRSAACAARATRSATSAIVVCPSIGRSGSSGSVVVARRRRARHGSRRRASDRCGCGHRGCRGGASSRATLRRRALRPPDAVTRPPPGEVRLSRRLRRRRHDGVARHRFGHRGVPFS